jgi:hypothetical protein
MQVRHYTCKSGVTRAVQTLVMKLRQCACSQTLLVQVRCFSCRSGVTRAGQTLLMQVRHYCRYSCRSDTTHAGHTTRAGQALLVQVRHYTCRSVQVKHYTCRSVQVRHYTCRSGITRAGLTLLDATHPGQTFTQVRYCSDDVSLGRARDVGVQCHQAGKTVMLT